MDISPEQIRWIVQGLIILVLSIAVHEFGHAIVAHKLGDKTPESQGRVTLNPVAHADPVGTLLFPLAGMLFLTKGVGGFGFGWGRPVMVNPASFSRKYNQRTAHMMVAAAGPAMNLVLAFIVTLVTVLLLKFGVLGSDSGLLPTLMAAIHLNFVLMFFNLIPAPPLDGGTILQGLLPDSMQESFHKVSIYGPFILMAVIFIPGLASIFLWPATVVTEILWKSMIAVVGI